MQTTNFLADYIGRMPVNEQAYKLASGMASVARDKHMKIMKKFRWILICIWVFTIIIMMIGVVYIGRTFAKEVLGPDYGVMNTLNYRENLVTETYRNLTTLGEGVQEQLQEDSEVFRDEAYLESLSEEADTYNASVLVLLDEEFIYAELSDDDNDVADVETALLAKKEIYNTGDNGSDEQYSFGDSGKIYDYVITSPQSYMCIELDYLLEDGTPISVFLIVYYGNYINELKSAILVMLVLMLLILIVLSAMFSLMGYIQFIKPLVRLKESVEEIGIGNLDTPVEIDEARDDEIGQLCRSVNDMREKLSDSVKLKEQYEVENRELISNISHDLKTPITTIKGYVEGIMDGVADTPEKRDRYLKMIYNKANELDTLINELSLYTNITNNSMPYEFHRVSVKDYFGDCMEEIRAELLSHNMTLTYKNYCKDDIIVVVDPDQLKRVINNIVNNAVKYTDKENGHIEIYIHETNDMIKVSINDDGKGIDKDSLPHIFDRTYRADSARQSRGGSGLGLAICKKIVEEHGGEIWATSQIGLGTTIYFTLRKYVKEENDNEQNTDN